jgi:hypothetical protein
MKTICKIQLQLKIKREKLNGWLHYKKRYLYSLNSFQKNYKRFKELELYWKIHFSDSLKENVACFLLFYLQLKKTCSKYMKFAQEKENQQIT